MYKITGIDISKETFDASFLKESKTFTHQVFLNNKKGFKQFLKWLPKESICVMEASGPYYLELATFLYHNSIKVYVVNPLAVRRFSQMKMYRAKTDKKDASIIAEYGAIEQNNLRVWQPKAETLFKMQQIYSSLELLKKQKHMSSRQLEAFKATGIIDSLVQKDLNSIIKRYERLIDRQENKLIELAKCEYKTTVDLLTSIPGIGLKTATLLLIMTNDFKDFENYKQLIAYIGFSPRIYQSGTSIKGKGTICKLGKSQLRKSLYLCAWSAKHHNVKCIEMYNRLKAKGKPERVIKVAIANKLIKQSIAIVKSGIPYNETYSHINPIIMN